MPKKKKAERQLYDQASSLCRHTNVEGLFDCTKAAGFYFCSDDGKILPGTTAHKRCGNHRLLGQRNPANIRAKIKKLNARLNAPKKQKRSPRVKTATQVFAKKESLKWNFPNADKKATGESG